MIFRSIQLVFDLLVITLEMSAIFQSFLNILVTDIKQTYASLLISGHKYYLLSSMKEVIIMSTGKNSDVS